MGNNRVQYRFLAGFLFVLTVGMLQFSCKKDPMRGRFDISFTFTFDGEPVVFDSMEYTIASGNVIRIDNIQYFISDVTLTDRNGDRHRFEKEENRIHYIDSDIPSTLQWLPEEAFETGVYDYIEFVYGLDSAVNRSGIFPDYPESNMFWPEALGGGYHYMKLNGYWAPDTTRNAVFETFGFHTGIGQTWQGETATAFHQNYVRLADTLRIFLTEGQVRKLTLNMEVAHWFSSPHNWDFRDFGGAIMQNQDAQQTIRENAWNVFTIK